MASFNKVILAGNLTRMAQELADLDRKAKVRLTDEERTRRGELAVALAQAKQAFVLFAVSYARRDHVSSTDANSAVGNRMRPAQSVQRTAASDCVYFSRTAICGRSFPASGWMLVK